MSETVANTSADATAETGSAPVIVAPEPTSAPAPEPASTGPLSRREARQAVRTDASKRAPVKVEGEVEATDEETTTAPVDDVTEAATPPAEAPAVEAPVESEAAKVSRVEIPASHPVRTMGLEALSAATPEEERVIRALLNGTYVRRQQLAELETENAKLRRDKVEFESRQSAQQKWEQSPEYQAAAAHYHQLKALEEDGTAPEGTAKRFWRGVQVDLQELQTSEFNERWSTVEQEMQHRAAEEWKRDAWDRANQLPQAIRSLNGFSEWFESAVQSFNAELRLGHIQNVKTEEDLHKAFTKFFGSRIVGEPAVVAAYKAMRTKQEQQTAAEKAAEQERARKAIEQEAVERFKREAAQKRQTQPPHPLGQVAGSSRDRVAGDAGGDEQDISQLSAHDIRRQARQGAREDARRHAGR